jgi:DNA-binding NtrC family response regulator
MSTPASGRILVIDDEPAMCTLLEDGLREYRHTVESVATGDAAMSALADGEFDMVITDLRLRDESGLALCKRIVARLPDLPVVVITAFGNFEAAVAAIRAGAYDFVSKPVDMQTLALVAQRAIAHHALQREVARLRTTVQDSQGYAGMVGESRAMRQMFDMIGRLEGSTASVLLRGESGTGKELVARALHDGSRYRKGPFVAINCAAVPPTLLESTLFGHVRGAFTDAKEARRGLFEEANGGTLLLDEIGEMPLEMQAKLLRVLQEKRVRPVGSATEIQFEARVISATNRDIEDAVAQGRFREDLFYRIAVITIEVPPLRMRGNDVLLLAQSFVKREAERAGKRVTGFDRNAARKLLEYTWPGNVRQLQNVIERATALARFEHIGIEDLPDKIADYESTPLVLAGQPEEFVTLAELETRYIAHALRAAAGNKSMCARILGIDRRTLHRKLGTPDPDAPPEQEAPSS